MGNPFRPHDTQGASFLPEDYVRRRAEMRANVISLGLFGVVMFGVIGAFFVTNRQWMTVRQEQLTVNQAYAAEARKIDQLQQIEAQKTAMISKAELTTALLEKVPRSILLAELITRMPQDITLLDLALTSKRIATEGAPQADKKAKPKPGSLSKGKGTDKDKAAETKKDADAKKAAEAEPEKPKVVPPKFEFTLKLNGVARVNNDITDYLSALNACLLLECVELTFIKPRIMDDVELREFEITAHIRNDADARSIEPVSADKLDRGIRNPKKKVDEARTPAAPAAQGGDKVTVVPDAAGGKE
jgi:Tfp pilus assembly protein PilN